MALSTHSRHAAVGLLALAALASCKKTDDAPVAPTAPLVAPVAESPVFFPGIGVVTLTGPAVRLVSGTLVSMRTDVNYLQPNSIYLQSTRTESVRASFYPTRNGGTPVAFEDAGEVKVNGIVLDKQADNSYFKAAGYGLTGSPLLTTTKTEWEVAGAGNVPAIPLYNQGTPFPSYNGTPFQRNGNITTRQVVLTPKPTATAVNLIDRNDDLVLPLGSNASAADSVYVIISNGNQKVTVRSTTQSVAAVGTLNTPGYMPAVPAPIEIKVPASLLQRLATNGDATAFLQTVAFRTLTITRGGKSFTFVKAGARFMPITIQ